jgi:hypothetical protein
MRGSFITMMLMAQARISHPTSAEQDVTRTFLILPLLWQIQRRFTCVFKPSTEAG